MSAKKPKPVAIDASDEMLGGIPAASKFIRTPSALKSRSPTGLNVAVLGGPTSLSYQAMHSIFDGESSLNVKYTDNFKQIFELIMQDKVHSGVIPVENTSMGPLPGMYDLILRYPGVHIIGEHIVVEDHCLCALPGTKLEDVEQIIAHPWAGAQCRGYLSRLVTNAKKPITRILANDTSSACKVTLANPNTATIQQRKMAEELGLAVLQESISDDENNKTRFVLVSKEVISLPKFEPMSTTVAFALQNRPNAMYKAFAVFGLRDINIRRMSARPTSKAFTLLPQESRFHWEYYMILDISGCPEHDKHVAAALNALDEFCVKKRVLGSYRVAQDRQLVARQRFNSVVETMRGGW